ARGGGWRWWSGRGARATGARPPLLPPARVGANVTPRAAPARSASVSPCSRDSAFGEPKRLEAPPRRSTPVRSVRGVGAGTRAVAASIEDERASDVLERDAPDVYEPAEGPHGAAINSSCGS